MLFKDYFKKLLQNEEFRKKWDNYQKEKELNKVDESMKLKEYYANDNDEDEQQIQRIVGDIWSKYSDISRSSIYELVNLLWDNISGSGYDSKMHGFDKKIQSIAEDMIVDGLMDDWIDTLYDEYLPKGWQKLFESTDINELELEDETWDYDELEEARLTEGCWSCPDTVQKAKELVNLLNKPLPASEASDKLYHLLGDDDLFDDIADYEYEEGPDYDVSFLVKSWIVNNILRSGDVEWNKEFDPKVINILKNALKKDPYYKNELTESDYADFEYEVNIPTKQKDQWEDLNWVEFDETYNYGEGKRYHAERKNWYFNIYELKDGTWNLTVDYDTDEHPELDSIFSTLEEAQNRALEIYNSEWAGFDESLKETKNNLCIVKQVLINGTPEEAEQEFKDLGYDVTVRESKPNHFNSYYSIDIIGTKEQLANLANDSVEADLFSEEDIQELNESLKEDTIKQNGKWVNKGKEGTHGTFKTKKQADAQRKAMFANGYKESLKEDWTEQDSDKLSNFNSNYFNNEHKKILLKIAKALANCNSKAEYFTELENLKYIDKDLYKEYKQLIKNGHSLASAASVISDKLYQQNESLKEDIDENKYIGKKAIFKGFDDYEDNEEARNYKGKNCKITSLDCEVDDDFESNYWDIEFEDGFSIDAVSGYYLDLIENESLKENSNYGHTYKYVIINNNRDKVLDKSDILYNLNDVIKNLEKDYKIALDDIRVNPNMVTIKFYQDDKLIDEFKNIKDFMSFYNLYDPDYKTESLNEDDFKPSEDTIRFEIYTYKVRNMSDISNDVFKRLYLLLNKYNAKDGDGVYEYIMDKNNFKEFQKELRRGNTNLFSLDILDESLKEDRGELNKSLGRKLGKLLLPPKSKPKPRYEYEVYWYDNEDCDGDPIFKTFSSKKKAQEWYDAHRNDADKFNMDEPYGSRVDESLKEDFNSSTKEDIYKIINKYWLTIFSDEWFRENSFYIEDSKYDNNLIVEFKPRKNPYIYNENKLKDFTKELKTIPGLKLKSISKSKVKDFNDRPCFRINHIIFTKNAKNESLNEARDYESEYNITPADKKKIIQWWKDLDNYYKNTGSKSYVSGIDGIDKTDDIDGWLDTMWDALLDLVDEKKNSNEALELLRRGKSLFNKYSRYSYFNYGVKESKQLNEKDYYVDKTIGRYKVNPSKRVVKLKQQDGRNYGSIGSRPYVEFEDITLTWEDIEGMDINHSDIFEWFKAFKDGRVDKALNNKLNNSQNNKSLNEDFETYGYIIRDKFTDEIIEENDRFTSKEDAYDKAVISYKTLLDENPGKDYEIEITNETIDTDFDESLKESNESQKKIDRINDYFDAWMWPSEDEIQEVINWYRLSKYETLQTLGKQEKYKDVNFDNFKYWDKQESLKESDIDKKASLKMDAYDLRDIFGRYYDKGLKNKYNLDVKDFTFFGDVEVIGKKTDIERFLEENKLLISYAPSSGYKKEDIKIIDENEFLKEDYFDDKEYITLPEDEQKQFEDLMQKNGWILDDETTKHGSKNFYPTWCYRRYPNAKDIHYQFITQGKYSEDMWDYVIDDLYDLLDECEKEFNTRIRFSAGLINDGSDYDGRGTVGIDIEAPELIIKGDDKIRNTELAGQKVKLKNGRPVDDASKKVIKDIEDHGFDVSQLGIKKDK